MCKACICKDCGAEFDKPVKVTEKHGFETGPFEVQYVCPECGSTNYCEAAACAECGEAYPCDELVVALDDRLVCPSCFDQLVANDVKYAPDNLPFGKSDFIEMLPANESAAAYMPDEQAMADRKQFVVNLGVLLGQTREGISGAYLDDDEHVHVCYANGYEEVVNVRCDSYTALIRDVAKAIKL